MKKISSFGIAFVAGAIALAGCAEGPGYQSQYPSPQPYPAQQYPNQGYSQGYQGQGAYFGVVDRIEVINRGNPNNVGGTVIGAIVGGLIGSQIGGSGTGAVVGAVGGAVVGNTISRQRASNEAFRISIRMNDGSYRTMDEPNIADLRTGDRVRVEGNNIYRI